MPTDDGNELKPQEEHLDTTRRDFVITTAGALVATGCICAAWPLIDSMNPSADVLESGTIEVDLAQIKEGETKVFIWCGKPIFVRHRTNLEILEARNVPAAELIDVQKDSQRVREGYESWLIVVGICTHLGCIPIANLGDYNGWMCPCHGSQYDNSGRVRRGPAPKNLEIPPYSFLDGDRLLIGNSKI